MALQAGMLLAHRYRLEALLGNGAMGQVWRAADLRLDRDVAVKVVLTEPGGTPDHRLSARLHREARAAAKLDHPGITTVFDSGDDRGHLFIVMQFLHGSDLDRELRAHPGGLPVDRAIDLLAQTAEALAVAHAHDVVHRDLKPANLMLLAGGRVKICDFGIAWYGGATALTRAGAPIGTPGYMAPEQWKDSRIDHRADLYALGCLGYALLTGRPPFDGSTIYQLMNQHLNLAPPSLGSLRAGVPGSVTDLLGALLAKEPADRPADASLVAAELRSARATHWAPRPAAEDSGAAGSRKKTVLGRRERVARGQDATIPLELCLQKTCEGSVEELTIETAAACSACSGAGTSDGRSPVPCPPCRGRGGTMTGPSRWQACERCDGYGDLLTRPCGECEGEGRVAVQRTLKVKIPAGVEHGTLIQFAGEGEVGPGAGEPGDLYLKIVELGHETFRREGDDLHCTLRIPLSQAVLGSQATLRDLTGKPVTFKIPPGVQPAQRFRLSGYGARHVNGEGRGDIYVSIHIDIPTHLDSHETAFFQDLARRRGESPQSNTTLPADHTCARH
ncbi:protein kinase domain-containing protein [Actinocorallia populi]|uniref:protein kinase domain-containing protein n=1 Tax=Actinocorallia populi TaxID=2079200 RepID=UPI000D08E601|nr:DnaJ C-terminal domain-containing protein [Actinocorallia populi]